MPEAIALPADAIAAVTHADPYPWYAALREGPPLFFDAGLGLWIASRAEVLREVFADDALRVRPLAEPVPRAIADAPAGEVFGHLVRMNEGPTHAARRPGVVQALAGLDRAAVLASAIRIGRLMPVAALSETCLDYPVSVVAHLLGFADAELPRVARWMRDFVACLSPLSSQAQLHDASAAALVLMRRFEALVARPPRDATLLAAVRSQAPDDASRAMLANLVGLMSQTCDATAGLLGNSLLAMARAPASIERLAPAAWAAWVAEVARHDPAAQNTRRFVARPTRIGGIALEPGDAVLLVLAAANRDPALNPEPDRFDPARAERRTLGFGHGRHACPGQALAETIAAAGLQALTEGGLDLGALVQRGWHYRPSVNNRVPTFH